MSRLRSAAMYRNRGCHFGGQSIECWLGRVDRSYRKIHEQEELAASPEMLGYLGLVNLKVDATASKIKTNYAHGLDAPFVLQVSSTPDLQDNDTKWVNDKIGQMLAAQMAAGGMSYDPPGDARSILTVDRVFKPAIAEWVLTQRKMLRAQARELAMARAKSAIAYQQGLMTDQLSVGGWDNAMVEMITAFVRDPYVVVCANEARQIKQPIWANGKVKYKYLVVPTWRYVDARNVYIAPDAKTAQDGEGVSEIVMRTREQLLSFTEEHGYKPAEIKKLVGEYQNKSTDWLSKTLSTAATLQARNGISDKSGWMAEGIKSVVHQGFFSGFELSSVGITGYGQKKDELYNCNVEVCGGFLIRMEVNKAPEGMRNYYSAAYKQGMSSYAGVSVAMKLHDRQLELNRLLLAKQKNQYFSSGPTYIPNAQYFDHVEEFKVSPYSIQHARPSEGIGLNGRPVDTINVVPMFRQLHEEIRQVMILADEEAGVPALLSGLSRGGVSRTTLGGAVLEQTNGELGMNDAIINFDKSLLEPMITSLHIDNLQNDTIPKEYRRGDVKVIGRGIYGLKEAELRARLQQQALPAMRQDAASGLVPQPMLQDALREYYASIGMDVGSMPSAEAQAEYGAIGMSPKPSTDARTYNPQQPTLGVQR
jgi:hypothetical protein